MYLYTDNPETRHEVGHVRWYTCYWLGINIADSPSDKIMALLQKRAECTKRRPVTETLVLDFLSTSVALGTSSAQRIQWHSSVHEIIPGYALTRRHSERDMMWHWYCVGPVVCRPIYALQDGGKIHDVWPKVWRWLTVTSCRSEAFLVARF